MIRDYRDFTIGSIFRGDRSTTYAERAGDPKLARLQSSCCPERVRIERFLAAGASIKGAARKFAIDYHALRRHWRNHVSAEVRATYVAGAAATKDELKKIVAERSKKSVGPPLRDLLYNKAQAGNELHQARHTDLLVITRLRTIISLWCRVAPSFATQHWELYLYPAQKFYNPRPAHLR